MKTRIFTLGTVLLVALTMNLFAEQVEKEVAEQIGKNYYWENAQMVKQLTYDEIHLSLFQTVLFENTAVYYIFNINDNDGFIIVSADNCAIPVIGYNTVGRFTGNNVPKPLNSLLNAHAEAIYKGISDKLVPQKEVLEEWVKFAVFNPQPPSPKSVNPLLSTVWDQGCAFNALCPAISYFDACDHAWAGCGAAAMAQLLKYHAYPTKGVGYKYHNDYFPNGSSNLINHYVDFGNTTYQYSNMPSTLGIFDSTQFHIAQLMYHCGVAAEMDYDTTESISYMENILAGLKNHFNYSGSAKWEWMNDSTSWKGTLKNELDQSRPVFYFGADINDNGHFWICDGYDANNRFHMNWAVFDYDENNVPTNYNGYFYITNLLAKPGGINFSYQQAAILDLAPSTYCAAWSDNPNSSSIAVVNFNNINNMQSKTIPWYSYTNYSAEHYTDVNQNATYQLEVITKYTLGPITSFAYCWIDWNQDGTFQNNESTALTWVKDSVQWHGGGPIRYYGIFRANVMVPSGAALGNTALRIRVIDVNCGQVSPCGASNYGEVEDYMVQVVQATQQGLDFGDAPVSYQTLLANNGARHQIVPSVYLGSLIDAETDGQPCPMALGDDLNNLDDEDGVAVQNTLLAGPGGYIFVTASTNGYLNAWIDHEPNGTWAELHDHVLIDYPVNPGINYIHMIIHPFANVGYTYARFRFSTMPGLNFYGPATDGEVEDYKMFLYPNSWYWMPTGKQHWIDIPASVQPIINGVGANPGDLIGAFYIDQFGVERCAAHVVWNGVNNLNFAISGDDPEIPGKEGFYNGEDIVWKIFSCTDLTTYIATATYDVTYPNFDGKFMLNGSSALTSLIAVSSQTQNIAVPQGWSGVSTHLMPTDANIVNICSGIQNDLTIIQSMLGVYWPAMNVNSIGNWNPYEGYKIKVNDDVTLCMTGTPLTNKTLNLSSGWHILPVLSSNNITTATVLGSPSVVIAKEISGNKVYWPAMSIYTLNVLETGKAYMVYLSSATTITFPAKGGDTPEPMKEELLNSPWNSLFETGSTHIIAISDAIAAGFDEGDLIGAFNSSGVNVGLAEFGSGNNVLVIYGDDAYTVEKDGMLEEEEIRFKVYRQKSGEIVEINPTFSSTMPNSGNYFVTDGISAIDFITTTDEKTVDICFEMYPNPVRDNLNIRFTNGSADLVTIEILNLLGETVCNPVFTDETSVNINLSHLAEGCYLMRVSNGTLLITRKIIVQ